MHIIHARVRSRSVAMVASIIATLAAGSLRAQQAPDLAPYLMPDRAAEIALARTAAPAHVSDSATVLVLTRKGYIEGAHGTNGFTCLVLRSYDANIGDPNFWNAHVRAPQCLNPAASRSILSDMLKRAEWIMAGVGTAEIATRTERAYAAHEFSMPAAGSMGYMISHEQFLPGSDPHWYPHLMFYFDKSMQGAAWGAGGKKPTVIDATADDPKAPVVTLMIPVRSWSDGTTAVAK